MYVCCCWMACTREEAVTDINHGGCRLVMNRVANVSVKLA